MRRSSACSLEVNVVLKRYLSVGCCSGCWDGTLYLEIPIVKRVRVENGDNDGNGKKYCA